MVRCKSCFQEYDPEFNICPYCGYEENDPPEEPDILPVGTILKKRYQIGQKLGRGGFGITYRAWDIKLNEEVAVKEFFPEGIAGRNHESLNVLVEKGINEAKFQVGLQHFLVEARILASVRDEHILKIYDYCEENHTGYMVRECLEGKTWDELIKEGTLSDNWQLNVKYAIKACAALMVLHQYHVIHRDICPGNLLIDKEDNLKIIDFGLARFADKDELSTDVSYTIGFASPEQINNQNQGLTTDIYSLAATLFYALTGWKVTDGADHSYFMEKMNYSEIPNDLKLIISHNLERNPKFRDQSASEFKNSLQRLLDADVTDKQSKAATPEKTVEREESTAKGRKIIPIIITTVLLIVVGIAALCASTIAKDKNKIKNADNQEKTVSQTISFWYIKSENKSEQAEIEPRMENLESAFHEKFPELELEISAFYEEDYTEKLRTAEVNGTLPTVYEVYENSSLPGEKNEKVVDAVLQSLEVEDYCGGKQFLEYIETNQAVPVKVNAYALFAYQIQQNDENEAGEILPENMLIISKSAENVYDQVKSSITEKNVVTEDSSTAVENFMSGVATGYYGNVADANYLKAALGEACTYAGDDYLQYEYTFSLQVSNVNCGEENIETFLEWLISDEAQTILFDQYVTSKNMPIRKNSFDLLLAEKMESDKN